ncbi:MAG: cupin domain-containing protein [Acidimicrobiales bacterium]
MTAHTPGLEDYEASIGELAGRYVDVDDLAWQPTPVKGVDMKVLLRDPDTGLLTALFRWEPDTKLDLHEHIEIEQSFVLSGSLTDEEGTVTAGNFVWRPKGNRHSPWTDDGVLLIAFFLKPNRFLEGAAAGQELA